jgi:hypothetical protein
MTCVVARNSERREGFPFLLITDKLKKYGNVSFQFQNYMLSWNKWLLQQLDSCWDIFTFYQNLLCCEPHNLFVNWISPYLCIKTCRSGSHVHRMSSFVCKVLSTALYWETFRSRNINSDILAWSSFHLIWNTDQNCLNNVSVVKHLASLSLIFKYQVKFGNPEDSYLI